MKITLYAPRPWQLAVHNDNSRFKVIVAHRRSGKTSLCINELIKEALLHKKYRYFYIAPTYKAAKMIAWEMLLNSVPRELINKTNETELVVRLKNGSYIELKGADNPDTLRGVGLDGVIFDEYSQQPSNIYSEIIRPSLSDRKGWATWIGTPKGKNAFFELYNSAQKKPEWKTWLLPVSQTNLISASELLLAKADMDDNEYNQEYECSFESIVKGAVYGEVWKGLVERHGVRELTYKENLPVYSAWDFGIGDATAIGIYQVSSNGEVYLLDYYENSDQPLQHYIDWIKGLNIEFKLHFGDPSGANRNLNTGRSVFEDLAAQKIMVFARPTRVIDKISATVKLIRDHLYVGSKCHRFIDAITNYHYTWDERRGEYSREPYHDWSSHACDQIGYFAVNYQVPARPLNDIEKKLEEMKKQTSMSNLNNFYFPR